MFFFTGIVSYLLIRKVVNNLNSFLLVSLNIIFIYFFYFYIFQEFSNDSKDYYNNTKVIFNQFSFIETILILFEFEVDNNFPIEAGNLFSKIYILFYLIFFFFGDEPYVLSLFYLLLKSLALLYLSNFLSRNFEKFDKKKKFLLSYLILLDPWTIYFQSFFFLKEGIIVFAAIINTLTFYKLSQKFKLRYIGYLLFSLLIIFYFRYYLVYVLFIFYLIYFFLSSFSKKNNVLSLIIPIILLVIFLPFIIDFRDIYNIIFTHFNVLYPLKYISSPIFINILISEDFSIRVINSLISNMFIIVFFIYLIKYNYDNKLINYLLLFILCTCVAQIFAHPEILTGGRHRGFVYWTMAVIVSLLFDYDDKTKKNNLHL